MIELWVVVGTKRDHYDLKGKKEIKPILERYRQDAYSIGKVAWHWHVVGDGCHTSNVIGHH